MAWPTVIDSRPTQVRLRAYGGDPFDLTVRLRLADGSEPDVGGWVWTAQVRLPDEVIDWRTVNLPNGVQATLAGADTDRVAEAGYRYWRFELVGRNPEASEGQTFLAGWMLAEGRLATPPAPPYRPDDTLIGYLEGGQR